MESQSEKAYISMRVKESAYKGLLKLKNDLSDEIGRTVSFSDVIEVLIDSWNLIPDEDRVEIIENLRAKKLGKVVGEVPIS